MKFDTPNFSPCGDHFAMVQFGDDASIDLNFMALGLTAILKEGRIDGVLDTNPSYNSVVVEYDFDRIGYLDLVKELRKLVEEIGSVDKLILDSRVVYIPALYLDSETRQCIKDYSEKIKQREYDPKFVARINSLTDERQLARVHSGTEHWVVAVCSTPGLPLMRALDPRCFLTSPKYNPPRTWTTLGAIGVGGLSTSIYTTPGPGGYNLIGRIPIPLWDPKQKHAIFKDKVVLLNAADRVKFMPIDLEEFEYIEKRIEDGSYEFNITAYQKFSVGAYKKWAVSVGSDARF